MKKAQMEMMGLAIIVILIVLGLLFAVRFVIKKDTGEKPPTEEYRTSELAANFLNAMLETNAPECYDISFSALYQDCANDGKSLDPLQFESAGSIQCAMDVDGVHNDPSCKYIKDKTKFMLDKTLEEWGKKYIFVVATKTENPFDTLIFELYNVEKSQCNNRRVKIQPLPATQPIYLWLYICEE